MSHKKALVVVLGDLARSPRMQNQCLSLSRDNYSVTVLASRSAENDRCCDQLEDDSKIISRSISDDIDFRRYLPSFLVLILKPIWQALLLIWELIKLPETPDLVLVQNPPSVPTLPIIYSYCLLRKSKFIIDWHNYGYSILALKHGPKNLFVIGLKHIEIFFGSRADAGFCVSKAMYEDLHIHFGVRYPLKVLYDKPPQRFKPLTLRERHKFLAKIQMEILKESESYRSHEETSPEFNRGETFITETTEEGRIVLKQQRPIIILTSTSWTEDEDFDLFYEALDKYEKLLDGQASSQKLPHLLVIITGKGPLKSYYRDKIKRRSFRNIRFSMPWLSAEDYAKMVASSDLTVCLHQSSSGIDLPMKVVDFFGCAIPVLARRYKAIHELVKECISGRLFDTESELFRLMVDMIADMDITNEDGGGIDCPMGRMRHYLTREYLKEGWEDHWNEVARPLLDGIFCR